MYTVSSLTLLTYLSSLIEPIIHVILYQTYFY